MLCLCVVADWCEQIDAASGKLNVDRWTDGELSASEKRILKTHHAADAWEHVCRNYPFEHVAMELGLGLAADGSTDVMRAL